MRIKIKKLLGLITGLVLAGCLCLALPVQTVSAEVAAGGDNVFEEWSDNILIVDPYRSWTINFSQPVDFQTAIGDNIYVLGFDQTYAPVRILPGNNDQQVVVDSPENGYEPQAYTLYISPGVNSTTATPLNPIKLRFYVIEL